MKYFKIANLSASTAVVLDDPAKFSPASPAPYAEGKDAMREYSMDCSTQHAYLSVIEGLASGIRVDSKENPPYRIHGIMVDYDGNLPDDILAYLGKKKQPWEYKPRWVIRTGSGHGRLVWELERSMLVDGMEHCKEFMKQAAKRMKLGNWLPGLDAAAFANPAMYYEIGPDWQEVPGHAPIPSAMAELWMIAAVGEVAGRDKGNAQYTIPLEDIAREVYEKFPGRWKGTFALGSRGVRFWDPIADNPTGALVREHGMQCFTGTQAFVPWRQIFGSGFVERYEAASIAGVINASAFDGQSFWLEQENGHWQDWRKDDFCQELRCRGYGSARGKTAASEIDKIENTIKKTRRVHRALPFLFYKPGIITYGGKPYLNIANMRCLEPATPYTLPGEASFADGMKYFPFIYELLKTMFNGPNEPESAQLPAFLAWLKYFYCNALESSPKPGHCVILAGVAGKGKTLLSRAVIGKLMGGSADGSSVLVDGSIWTDNIAHAPLMTIDDQLASSDPRSLLKFSSRIKRYVANSMIDYNQKYKQAAQVPWFGRIFVTCNMDSESLRILPNMDISTADKICLFRAADNKMIFPQWDEVERTLEQELPMFARFLVEWTMPKGLIASEKRFGVLAYHHPELFEESRQQGIGVLYEVMTSFLADYQKQYQGKPHWEGSATQLHSELNIYSPSIMKDMSPKTLSMQLGTLSKNGFNLTRYKDTESGVTIWKIAYKLRTNVIEERSGT